MQQVNISAAPPVGGCVDISAISRSRSFSRTWLSSRSHSRRHFNFVHPAVLEFLFLSTPSPFSTGFHEHPRGLQRGVDPRWQFRSLESKHGRKKVSPRNRFFKRARNSFSRKENAFVRRANVVFSFSSFFRFFAFQFFSFFVAPRFR